MPRNFFSWMQGIQPAMFWRFYRKLSSILAFVPLLGPLWAHTAQNGWRISPNDPRTFLFLVKNATWRTLYFLNLTGGFLRGEACKVQNIILGGGLQGPVEALANQQHWRPQNWTQVWSYNLVSRSFERAFHVLSIGTPVCWTILHRLKALGPPLGPTGKVWVPGDITFWG